MAVNTNEDIGFCSSEESYIENEILSPTDNSEDSVEVKVCQISLKNKRKLFEPRKSADIFTGPLKKRMCRKVKAEHDHVSTPFRPWSPPQTKSISPPLAHVGSTNTYLNPLPVKSEIVCPTPGAYFRPSSSVKCYNHTQTEPVSLVIKREKDTENYVSRVPVHPQVVKLSTAETEHILLKTNEQFPILQRQQTNHSAETAPPPVHTASPDTSNYPARRDCRKIEQRREQRNYKNMTRERRIEANARERTRVHTISAAFETLRRSVPAYSHNQKLSKLSVLRIACSYIMTLSTLAEESQDSISECVEAVSRTIQKEGKLRKKKDDND